MMMIRRQAVVLFCLALGGCLLASLAPISIHVKLLLAIVVLPIACFLLLLCWQWNRPRARHAILGAGLCLLAGVLASELATTLTDRAEAKKTAALRTGAESMLTESKVSSFVLKPSRMFRIWGGTIELDRNGFRSTYDVSLQKEPSQIRVALLGGSSALGWLVPDGQDIAAYMRTILNEQAGNTQFEVINAAVPYYNAFEELNRYLHVVSDYQPDYLVVLHGHNDAQYAIAMGEQWRPVREEGVKPVPLQNKPEHTPPNPFKILVKHCLLKSALYRRLYAYGEHLAYGAARSETPRWTFVDPRFIDQFLRHRAIIASQAQQNNTTCILALQPVIHLGKPLTEDEKRYSRMFGDITAPMKRVWPKLQRAATQANLSHAIALYLTGVFADCTQETYVDACHYSPEGNRIIANCLAKVILDCQHRQYADPDQPHQPEPQVTQLLTSPPAGHTRTTSATVVPTAEN